MKAAGNASPAGSEPAAFLKSSTASAKVKARKTTSTPGNAMRNKSNPPACAVLGQGAPNPVVSTLKHFRSEYEAHIYEKRCPAKVCRSLIRYEIIPDACTGCTVCARNCPANAISGERRQTHIIDPDTCIRCGICMQVCNFNAIEIK